MKTGNNEIVESYTVGSTRTVRVERILEDDKLSFRGTVTGSVRDKKRCVDVIKIPSELTSTIRTGQTWGVDVRGICDSTLLVSLRVILSGPGVTEVLKIMKK